MEVRIQAIQKKTAKLEKYCDDINKVEVSLKVVKPETAMNKEASIKVLVPNGANYPSIYGYPANDLDYPAIL